CEEAHRALIRPGQPVPEAATAVHGINDDALCNAPEFRKAWPEFWAQINNRIVIGHSIGFDLAVLQHECKRAGIDWVRPRCLDVGLLAHAVRPDLAGYSMEELAAWLGIAITDRHSARGD